MHMHFFIFCYLITAIARQKRKEEKQFEDDSYDNEVTRRKLIV